VITSSTIQPTYPSERGSFCLHPSCSPASPHVPSSCLYQDNCKKCRTWQGLGESYSPRRTLERTIPPRGGKRKLYWPWTWISQNESAVPDSGMRLEKRRQRIFSRINMMKFENSEIFFACLISGMTSFQNPTIHFRTTGYSLSFDYLLQYLLMKQCCMYALKYVFWYQSFHFYLWFIFYTILYFIFYTIFYTRSL
jgi:hypothetical protein